MMEFKQLAPKQISANLIFYSIAHAIVDATCAGVLFSLSKNQNVNLVDFGRLVILYNILAFSLQIVFGLIIDHFKSPKFSVFGGFILIGVSIFTLTVNPILAVILAGTGNALFHVGGGSISLNLTPKKASAPGIFVAPGALGLMTGVYLGTNGQFIAWPFILILTLLCISMFFIKKPEMNYNVEIHKENQPNYLRIIILFILLSVAIRSLVGMSLVFPWKSEINLLIILTLVIVLGKAFGGILADKFGMMKIALGSLLLSMPLLMFSDNVPFLAITGMFLFNISMPVTLVVISNLLPGRPGFAFGLTCMALIIGSLPSFSSLKYFFGGKIFIFAIIIVSVISLYFGLRNYFIYCRQQKENV
jgi:MFS transporter, FSR family, fosmidomycin resistance protein